MLATMAGCGSQLLLCLRRTAFVTPRTEAGAAAPYASWLALDATAAQLLDEAVLGVPPGGTHSSLLAFRPCREPRRLGCMRCNMCVRAAP